MVDWLQRSWVEVSLDNINANVLAVREKLPQNVELAAVVKADAYGHGSKNVVREMDEAGVDRFCVSNFNEALVVRDSGIKKPIIVLGYTPPEYAEWLSKLNIIQTVVDKQHALKLSEAAAAAKVIVDVHIKLDTGMGRLGMNGRNLETTCREIVEIASMRNLYACGLYTHFAVADNKTDFGKSYTEAQRSLFVSIAGRLAQLGERFNTLHCSNSAGILFYPEFCHNMVRPGIMLYGISPTGAPIDGLELKPVMSLKSTVSMVKPLRVGESVSYGCTFTAQKEMTIAVVSIGYADGIPRLLSNKGYCYINDTKVPIVGTICMDMLMIDVSEVQDEVKNGDIVTFFGGDCPITVEAIAKQCGTIGYEIVCGISRRVPRIYKKGGETVEIVDYTLPRKPNEKIKLK